MADERMKQLSSDSVEAREIGRACLPACLLG